MIFASLNGFENRPGLGALAAATLVQGTHFNCNASICYGIGAPNHQALKDLQTAINRYAFGAKPLVVDGFIGSATVTAARGASAMANFTTPTTKEALTASALSVTQRLNAFLDEPATLPTPTKPPSVATVTSSPSAPGATTTQPRPGTVTTPTALAPVVPTPFRPDTVSTSAAAAAAAALIPLAPKKAPVPIWVWVTAGVAGVIVVGLVGYAIRKPEPVALANWRSYSRRPRGGSRYREW
jgi:hypothetical protein